MTNRQVTLQNRRGTTLQWAASNRILLLGEIGYDTDLKEFRMGDGISLWPDLEVFIPLSEIQELIDTAMDGVGPGDDGNPQALTNHINSETPHPIYDDGPSFALLYENAKV